MRDGSVASVGGVASTGIFDLLAGRPRSGHVLGVSSAAAYLAFPPSDGPSRPGGPAGLPVVALEGHGAVGLPLAVTLTSAPSRRVLTTLRPSMRVAVGDGRLTVGDIEVRVHRWRDPRPRLRRVTPDALAAATGEVAALLPPAADALDRTIEHHAAALDAAARAHDVAAALATAERMIGLGAGSTPSGDDVLAGFVAGGRLLTEAVAGAGSGPRDPWFTDLGERVAARAVDRTPALSAALLHHAARAEVVTPAAAVLRALAGDGDTTAATVALLTVGHRSGADLALGVVTAARTVTATSSSPRRPGAHHARTR